MKELLYEEAEEKRLELGLTDVLSLSEFTLEQAHKKIIKDHGEDFPFYSYVGIDDNEIDKYAMFFMWSE